MIYVGIIGFGVVGSGVAEVIAMNAQKIERHLGQELSVKRILDIRKFDNHPFSDRMTVDPDVFFGDEDISIVVEAVGGVGIAYDYTVRALSSGRTVVTSNKELVSTHGVELMQLSVRCGCSYLFEASVGGGIPIIRPLHRCLAANRIMTITGILNGTTNYILSRMAESEIDFDHALLRAKEKGYAEQDPSTDIEGVDTQRKIAILSSIAMNGAYVDPKEIHTEGISSIGVIDIEYARALGHKIKLLAIFENPNDREARILVAPHLVSSDDPLAVADGVYNAIFVYGNALGGAMFYGKGAGKYATASAVVGDILDGALHRGRNAHITPWYYAETRVVSPFEDKQVKALIRVSGRPDIETIARYFPGTTVDAVPFINEKESAFIVGKEGVLTERELQKAVSNLSGFISKIRIYTSER
ncbi:MAG: homoserine dehydrogenase [Clostridiaceae bacterium]|nr:homoserine dehydrogenase [Clostridiaceae bacterium]